MTVLIRYGLTVALLWIRVFKCPLEYCRGAHADRWLRRVHGHRRDNSQETRKRTARHAGTETEAMKLRSPIRKRRLGPPRRGRLVDEAYMAWLHTQPGLPYGGPCHTVHHVRSYGSPKNDRRAIPMEFGAHQIQEGPLSIEAIGKQKWEALHGLNIHHEIAQLQRRYLDEHPNVKWE